MPLTENIKSLALEAGFHAAAVTTAAPFQDAQRLMLERLEQGVLHPLPYNEDFIRARNSPQEILPSARSIISVALSYLTDDPEPENSAPRPRGFMARFSRGLDYHPAIRTRMDTLAERIKASTGAQVLSFADTRSMADRPPAIRSGLGAQGKNACLYVHGFGSWVVLGELVTDLEIEPDSQAHPDICGDCTMCMDACPTGAIRAPRTISIKDCLAAAPSFRGFMPAHLREKLGNCVYGCDICQNVCPLNRNATPGNLNEFRSSTGLGAAPELIPLLLMGPKEFDERIAPTTAGWIGITRFRRNVVIALGNSGDTSALPALLEALSDPDPIIRGHAAWALARLDPRGTRPAIEHALSIETDEAAIQELHTTLAL